MHANIEKLEKIILSNFEDREENGIGFNVNGISFSLTLEQANSIIFFYIDSRCVIYYEGVEFLTGIKDAKRIEAKIKKLQG